MEGANGCCFFNMLSHHSPVISPRSCGAHWCWICEEQIVGSDTAEMGISEIAKAWMTWCILKRHKTTRKWLVTVGV